jgi:hypothetical protein
MSRLAIRIFIQGRANKNRSVAVLEKAQVVSSSPDCFGTGRIPDSGGALNVCAHGGGSQDSNYWRPGTGDWGPEIKKGRLSPPFLCLYNLSPDCSPPIGGGSC